jgi:hypothetical protein
MSELKHGSYEWFESFTQKDYEETLKHVDNLIRKVIQGSKFSYTFTATNVKTSLCDGVNLLRQADWQDPRLSKHVYKFLFKQIIPMVDIYERTYRVSDVRNSWRESLIRRYVKTFKKRLEKGYEKKSKQEKSSYVLSTLNISVTPTTLDMKTLFPQVDPILGRIEIRQKHAQKLELSIEEQYFFENVKDQLLPAIFTAADRIKNSPSNVRDEAIDNFVQQLGLIEKRMSDMIADAEQRTLADVRNQTAFLVESMERKQIAS